jgi:hypothetical protein
MDEPLKVAEKILPQFWKTKLAILERLETLVSQMDAGDCVQAYKALCDTEVAEDMAGKLPG